MPKGVYIRTEPAWNKGLNMNIDDRIKKISMALKGKKKSEDIRRHMSEAHKGQVGWSKGLTKKIDARVLKISEATNGKKRSEEAKKRISISHKGLKFTEEQKKNMSLAGIKRWQNPQFREKTIKNIVIGKRRLEAKLKTSKSIKRIWQNPQFREKTIKGMIIAFNTPEIRIKKSENGKRIWQNQKYRENQIKERKERWQNPQFREKTIKATLKALFKRPTTFEQKIIELINKNNLPFKYVGNGGFILGGKNPDFIETNGRKILIEVYNDFHHPKDYEERRNKVFSKYGYKTIFINEATVLAENWEELCLNKINGQNEQN